MAWDQLELLDWFLSIAEKASSEKSRDCGYSNVSFASLSAAERCL